MASLEPPSSTYRFGLFEADRARGTLQRNGVRVRLQEQPFRVLCLLLARPGELVTRDELRQALWPADTYVEFDGGLNGALKRLRAALGESADNPTFIETVPKRGYRFIAPVSINGAGSKPALRQGNGLVLPEEFPPADPAAPAPVAASSSHSLAPRHRTYGWALVAVILASATLAVLSWLRMSPVRHVAAQQPPVVAVLPFRNEQGSPDLDFLRFAIPDDIVTDLTYSRALSVRPFAATSKYAAQTVDPEAVGRDLKVTHLVSGEFIREGQSLQITLELIEIETNRAVWRKTITVDPSDLIGLHKQLEYLVRDDVMSELRTPGSFVGEIPTPRNARAFSLYMTSASVSRDPAPNKLAIKRMEESVALDPDYAPAWIELGWRYYIDSHYADGGPSAMAKSEQADQRAIDLDPHGTTNLITIKSERGDLIGAYEEARRLLKRRPDTSVAHYEMSYVLRYAGLLDEAGQECDRGLRIDPGWFLFRSCAIAFYLKGNYSRAQDYIQVDEASGFAARSKLSVTLRQQKYSEAATLASQAAKTGSPWAELISARLDARPDPELAAMAGRLDEFFKVSRDPEDMYEAATALSFAGQSAVAVRLLRRSVEHHYCSYPAMVNDPLLEAVRERPEFRDLEQAGMKCQQDFVAYRAMHSLPD